MKFLKFIPLIAIALSCTQASDRSNSDKETTSEDIGSEYGSSLNLPEPYSSEPVNKFAKVVGWKEGESPVAPTGYRVVRFAHELDSPRSVYVAPNGDIFVAQSRTERSDEDPEKRDSRNLFHSKSPNQILRFRDEDLDGVAEAREVFLDGLSQPYGMLITGGFFYVANTDGVLRYPYDEAKGTVSKKAEKILSLPAGGYNNHWTRNLVARKDGSKIYISVGSGSNVGENGMEHEVRRAAILEINPDGSGERVFAAGIRNPVGMDFEPQTGVLWTAVNERDQLGDELVPDYITSVREGGFYGWPYTYWGSHPDPRWEGKAPDSLVNVSLTPDFAVGAHTASLGIAFNAAPGFDTGAFVGQHGSWNRSEFSGYKVIFIPFQNGRPSGEPLDFLSGFVADETRNEVYGRPVDIAFTRRYMLVTDDAANTIWAVLPEDRQ